MWAEQTLALVKLGVRPVAIIIDSCLQMPISAQQWRLAVGQMNATKRCPLTSTSKALHSCQGNPNTRQEYVQNLLTVLHAYFLALGSLVSDLLHSELNESQESRKWAIRRVRKQGWVFLWLRLLLFITALLLLMGGDVERNPGPTQG